MTWRFRYSVLLMVVFFVGWAIALMPARVLLVAVSAAPISLGQTTGTVWRGQTDRLVIVTDDVQFDAGTLHWRVSPWPLLRGNLCLQVQALNAASAQLRSNNQQILGQVCVNSRRDVSVNDTHIQLPAASLLRSDTLRLQGQLDVQVQQARLTTDGRWQVLDARGLWSDAALLAQFGRGWSRMDVGNVPLSATALPDGSAQLMLDNHQIRDANHTGISVQAQFAAAELLRMDAQITPDGPAADALRQWLAVIAEPADNGGGFQFMWRAPQPEQQSGL